MPAGPPTLVERFVAILLPVKVREEVLGDLHERYQSVPQYLAEALRTVPLVLVSRIRRTADRRLATTLGLLICLCYVGVAWFAGGPEVGLTRLALPAIVTLLGVLLADAYARQGDPVHAPALGTALALLAESALAAWYPALALPRWILLAASLGLVLVSATRLALGPAPPPRQTAGSRAAPLTESATVPIGGYVLRMLAGLALLVLWYQLRKEVIHP